MSDDIRLYMNAIEGNHSLESQPMTREDKMLLNELNEVEIKEPSSTRRNPLAHEEKPRIKIQRVRHFNLKYKHFDESYYKPREVSIGPIHADSSNLLKRELRIKLAGIFVKRSGKTGEALLRKIKAKVDKLRECFDEADINDYDNKRLSRLLFLDGCFLLQFVDSYLSDNVKDLEITNDQAARISNDLLLAENQIPFLVLKLLMDSCDYNFRKTLKTNVLIFVGTNMPIGDPNYIRSLFVQDEGHFLFLLKWGRYLLDNTRNLFKLVEAEDRVHLLDLLRAVQLYGNENIIDNKDKKDGELSLSTKMSFRNVQDLKFAGIKLRPSGSCSLKAISFSTKCFISGQLKLPTFTVDNSTVPKLWNLVAYEMCLKDHETVTSYLNFLDLLIDNEQDVKDLRAAYILRNHLSSDTEVAQLFNSIGYSCRTAVKDDYSKVKNKIQKHYQRKTTIWIAEVYNDQFKSPWTVIALLAAAIILTLTAIQTWYAVHPKQN